MLEFSSSLMESSYQNSNSDVLWKHVLGKVFSGQLSGEASLFSSSFFSGTMGTEDIYRRSTWGGRAHCDGWSDQESLGVCHSDNVLNMPPSANTMP